MQPRQIYAISRATSFGWHGDVAPVVRNGLDYLDARYRHDDGLDRTLIAADGSILDDHALLYDQAFVLLGFAAAAEALDARSEMEGRALALRSRIEQTWRSSDGGFSSGEGVPDRRESNPHMHLLEACLAWSEIGIDPDWANWAETIAEIGMSRFINPRSGTVMEVLTNRWLPVEGLDGRRVEPGHMFEWAWLLLRLSKRGGGPSRLTALRLIDVAESTCVHRGVAVNALLDDVTAHDPNARLWPQTERLKAALLAKEVTGEGRYIDMAASAAGSLIPFLETATPGVWFDEMAPDGTLKAGVVPASTFYHLNLHAVGIPSFDAKSQVSTNSSRHLRGLGPGTPGDAH